MTLQEAPGRNLDLSAIGAALWRQKWLVIGVLAVALLCAFVSNRFAAKYYTVTLKVTSVALYQSQNQGQLNSRLSSLASLAGVGGLPSSSNGISFDLYLELLKGREAGRVLAARPDIVHQMFPAEWDAANNTWRQPHSLMRSVTSSIKALLGLPVKPWSPPDAARVQDAISDSLTISKSPYTPVVTISLRTGNPEFGQYLLGALHLTVDDALRAKSLDRAARYISYLKDQLNSVTNSDYRAALIATMIDQEKQRMVASSGLSFAAEPVEAPTASNAPTSSGASTTYAIWLLIGAVIGGLLAIFLDRNDLTVREALRRGFGVVGRRFRRGEISERHVPAVGKPGH